MAIEIITCKFHNPDGEISAIAGIHINMWHYQNVLIICVITETNVVLFHSNNVTCQLQHHVTFRLPDIYNVARTSGHICTVSHSSSQYQC